MRGIDLGGVILMTKDAEFKSPLNSWDEFLGVSHNPYQFFRGTAERFDKFERMWYY